MPVVPAVHLVPKNGMHEKNENGNDSLLASPYHPVVQRAGVIGRSQKRQRHGQGASEAHGRYPPHGHPEIPARRKHARASQTSDPNPPASSRQTVVEREKKGAEGAHHKLPPTNPPASSALLKGEKTKQKNPWEAKLPKKFHAHGEKSSTQWEKSLKGVSSCEQRKDASSQRVPTAPKTTPYKGHRSWSWYKPYLCTVYMLGGGRAQQMTRTHHSSFPPPQGRA